MTNDQDEGAEEIAAANANATPVHRFQFCYCQNCEQLHMLFFDEDDELFAQAVLGKELCEYLIRELQAHLASGKAGVAGFGGGGLQ